MRDGASDGLLKTVMDAEVLYQARLAEFLHDQPLQTLAAATLRLDMLRERAPEVADSVQSIVELLGGTVARLRLLVALLEPPDLDAGLGTELRRLASAASHAGLDVSVGGDASVDLDERSATAALRIVADALLSIAPSTARPLAVDLTQSADGARLTVIGPASIAGLADLLTRIAARAEASGGLLTTSSVRQSSTFFVSWTHRVSGSAA
ncbi:MAG: histidine kinase [bacterium]|nr:histidine kinase [bacterium]